MEPIFKVGEKVRIKIRTDNEGDYKFGFTSSMNKYSGEIFTIKEVYPEYCLKEYKISDDNAKYVLKEDKDEYSWSSSMLDRISEISSDSLIKPRKKLVLNFKI